MPVDELHGRFCDTSFSCLKSNVDIDVELSKKEQCTSHSISDSINDNYIEEV